MNFLNKNMNFFINWVRNLDKVILTLLFLWIVIGLILTTSSTLGFASLKLYNDSKILINKYYLFIFLAVIIITFASFFNEIFYKRSSKIFFYISFFLLLLTLILGLEVKGSKRWLNLFFFNLQPVELLKPSLIIFLASIYTSNNSLIFKFSLSIVIAISSIIILLLQPDYTQALIILVIWFIFIFMSGINLIVILLSLGTAIGFMISILFFFKEKFSYIFARFEKWLNVSDISYQSEKSIDAIINGGFWGRGIGEGFLKEKIPEAHTDYILASISEEFGIIAIILILIIVFFLFMRVFAICQTNISEFKKYVLVALSTTVLIQVFINVGVTINMLPPTGMPFAFLSYGGSSIITNAFIMGIILSLTKKNYT